MNDVKYLCEQLLDAPPPLRDGAEVLATARRSTARRSAVRATGGALAVAALTGAAVLVAPAIAANSTATTVQLAAPKPSEQPPSPAPPPPEVPYAQASSTHDKKMLETIKRALPAGFTAASQYPLATDPTPYPTDPTVTLSSASGATLAATISILVSSDGRVGWLSATIVNDGRPLPTGDLCGPGVGYVQPGATCSVIDVDGTRIRITREHWDNTAPEIDVIVATKFLRNGSLSIVESRSVPDFQSEKDPLPPDAKNKHPKKQTPTSALGDWFLTDQQLAELVASPGMLP